MPRQSISRQIDGMRLSEAATSRRKIEGTISRAGMRIEIAVIESSEKPKPEKPRTIAARKIAALDIKRSCQWTANWPVGLSHIFIGPLTSAISSTAGALLRHERQDNQPWSPPGGV